MNLFTRYALDARYYRPVFAGVVARGKLTLGWIKDWDKDHPVPISEKYYVGGINSVRGYRFLSIAPTQDVGCNPKNAGAGLCPITVGGDKQAILNLELEFPIFDKVGVRGVLFGDAGNAFPSGKFTDPNVSRLALQVGRVRPALVQPHRPAAVRVGHPARSPEGQAAGAYIDAPLDFQFTIGNFF